MTPFEMDTEPRPLGPMDEVVFAHWKKQGIVPARPCSDGVFVRRVYLDLIGTLPTAREAREFILSDSKTKRTDLVEKLLGREEYADWWALRWSDILRIKAEFPINLWPNAVQAYHRWVRDCVKQNMPYDRFAVSLVTASGSNFRVPQVNFYRAMQSKDPRSMAEAFARVFLGERTDKWPKSRLDGLAAFFTKVAYKKTLEWKEEIVFFDPTKDPGAIKGAVPTFPDGKRATVAQGRDPRSALASWLTAPGNPWFARAAANRIWFWLFGRGIVHEPDDMRRDNPPSIPALLAWLERSFVASGYDVRALCRTIVNSATYQLSAIPRTDAAKAERNFAAYPVRRLEAEVLADALNQITGSTESYSSQIPEPFTFIPERQRSIALADGSISSSFLEMFGRPARDTGTLTERNNKPSAAQRLHMLNSGHVQRKLQQSPAIRTMTRLGRQPRDAIVEIYLTFLSRFPTSEEASAALRYAQQGGIGRDPGMDIAWALLNSAEFMFRH